MRVVIDIDEFIYKRWAMNEMPTVGQVVEVQNALKDGTPLPNYK